MTARLPFNPARMAAQPAPAPPSAIPPDAPLTVSQLAGRISAALDAGLPAKVRVIGQVTNFRDRTHWYFDLKDAGAVVSCAMFQTQARKARFTPTNGQEVIATGRVEFWDKAGKTSLIIDKLEPVGAGALELAFRALCDELKTLGWFDHNRKRPIPAFPRRVAVITSRTGAALQDVLDTARRRCCATDFYLLDARVQGDGAAAEVAAALRWLAHHHARLQLDAILVTRGGGSIEDLWAFNERVVAEAIIASPVPVVAAIGHETDTTIAELVADLRCATPTQAAVRLTPDGKALTEQLDSLTARLRAGAQRSLRDRRARVIQAARHPLIARPGELVDRARRALESLARHARTSITGRVRASANRLERLAGRLEAFRPAALHARRAAALESARARLAAAAARRLAANDLGSLAQRLELAWDTRAEREDTRLQALARQLAAIGPMAVLRRGFSYTMREDGTLLRSPEGVAPGDRLRTRLAEGELRSRVEGDGPPPRPLVSPEEAARPTPRKRRPRPQSPDQMDLFKPAP
ncbi:MAG: exodeoxyribonuclease VII large subunit [Phycisphaerales bacterium]